MLCIKKSQRQNNHFFLFRFLSCMMKMVISTLFDIDGLCYTQYIKQCMLHYLLMAFIPNHVMGRENITFT